MKHIFPMYQKEHFFNRYFWVTALLLIVFFFVIFPFLSWMFTTSQPFSMHLVGKFLHERPFSEKQIDNLIFMSGYSLVYIFIGVLRSQMKLVITPEKIYYMLFKIPLGTWVERQAIEYCQMAVLKPQMNKYQTFLNRPIFKTKLAQPQEKLYFFPLRNLQLDLGIEQLNEKDKTQVIELLKQYYNFQEDVREINLTSKEANALVQEQMNLNISPRIAYLLITSVLLGALAIFLEMKAPFLFFTNYPTFPVLCSIFILLLIPSFLWIRQDIKMLAFFGAILSSAFITIALAIFLLPILHAYYTQNFGKTTIYSAKLIEITEKNQVWQPSNGDKKFYIQKKSQKYNANLKPNQTYAFPAHYHWHNYTLSEDVFLNAKPLATKLEP